MKYKVWLRYGTRGQDTRDIFREVEALSEGHALTLVRSMTQDYSRTFDSNVSPVEEVDNRQSKTDEIIKLLKTSGSGDAKKINKEIAEKVGCSLQHIYYCKHRMRKEAGPERMRFHFDKVYADDSPLMTVKYVYRRIHDILDTSERRDQLQDLSNFYSELAENYYKVVGEKIGDPYD